MSLRYDKRQKFDPPYLPKVDSCLNWLQSDYKTQNFKVWSKNQPKMSSLADYEIVAGIVYMSADSPACSDSQEFINSLFCVLCLEYKELTTDPK